MAVLQSCCFWKTVRKGSMASASYTLVYFGFSTLVMLITIYDEQEFLTGRTRRPVGESILAKGAITPALVIFNILFLICSLFLVISSLLVFMGLKHNRRELLLPWIVFMLCDVLIELFHLIYLSVTQMVNFDPIVGFIFTIDFFIMCLNQHLDLMYLNVNTARLPPINMYVLLPIYFAFLMSIGPCYCLLCVISQYQNYQQGRGYADQQIRTEVMLHSADGGVAVRQSYLTATKIQKSFASPYITTNPHTHISTIPEEMDQNHRNRTSSETPSEPAEDNIIVSIPPPL